MIIKNQKGVTLVELLASLILITIILLAFFSIFIQSSKHTKFNEEKLTSIEIAEDVIATIRSIPDNYKDNEPTHDVSKSPDYTVLLTITDGPNKLKKATIKVKPVTEKGIKQSPFETQIYYEVSP